MPVTYNRALLIIDGGDLVSDVTKLNQIIRHAEKNNWLIICILGISKDVFHPKLRYPGSAYVISDNIDTKNNNPSPLEKITYGICLDECLRASKINILYVSGLPTDNRIQAVIADALCNKKDYINKVYFIYDACRKVSSRSNDELMSQNDIANVDPANTGATFITAEEIISRNPIV